MRSFLAARKDLIWQIFVSRNILENATCIEDVRQVNEFDSGKMMKAYKLLASASKKNIVLMSGMLHSEGVDPPGHEGQTLQGSFSAVSKPIFCNKVFVGIRIYSLESSRRDLHNALLCTVLESDVEKSVGKRTLPVLRSQFLV